MAKFKVTGLPGPQAAQLPGSHDIGDEIDGGDIPKNELEAFIAGGVLEPTSGGSGGTSGGSSSGESKSESGSGSSSGSTGTGSGSAGSGGSSSKQ